MQFCNAITTNLTSFFREPHHFEHLRSDVLTPLLQKAGSAASRAHLVRRLLDGRRALLLAMTVLETVPDIERWDIRILATDLDSDVLGKASRWRLHRRAAAPAERRAPRALLHAATRTAASLRSRCDPELRRLITFKQLNLMHPLAA